MTVLIAPNQVYRVPSPACLHPGTQTSLHIYHTLHRCTIQVNHLCNKENGCRTTASQSATGFSPHLPAKMTNVSAWRCHLNLEEYRSMQSRLANHD